MKWWIFLTLLCATSLAFAAQEVQVGGEHLRLVLDARLSPDIVKMNGGPGIPVLRSGQRCSFSVAKDSC